MKTVLITGASKGIGLAVSLKLVKAGYRVIGIARTEPHMYPGILLKCDLADTSATSILLDEINNNYKIDSVINNVGIVIPEPVGRIDLFSLSQAYDLNVRVSVQVVQACIANMQKQKYGRIVNISSRAILGGHGLSSYSAAKSALIGLTRTWALELAQFNITVNAVAPGYIDTTLLTLPQNITKTEAARQTPLGRIGKPEEIASTIKFLLSKDAGFMTGQTLFVDGGRSL